MPISYPWLRTSTSLSSLVLLFPLYYTNLTTSRFDTSLVASLVILAAALNFLIWRRTIEAPLLIITQGICVGMAIAIWWRLT